MQTIYGHFILVLFLFLFTFGNVFAQANSVELYDGTGTLVSTHSGIEEAYNAIPSTITQAYIIEILAAYNGSSEVFPIDLSLKSGHSSANTITIRPDTVNSADTVSGNNSLGIINIIDADYIILDGRPGGIGSSNGLTIRNTATTGTNANTIQLSNGATNCVIRYINSINATAGTTGVKNIELADSPSNPSGVSDNLIEYCYVSGGRTGIGFDGGPIATANPNFNNLVRKCTIVDFGFNGIWLLNATAHTTIEDCFISSNFAGVNITNPSGINIQSTYDGYVYNIRRNIILDIKSTSTSTSLTIRGINTVTAPGTNSVINIENNFIALNANNNNAATTYGILSTGTTENHTLNIYYNTILIGGTQTGGATTGILSAGIMKTSALTGMNYRQKNNISINRRTGGPAGAKHTGSSIEPAGNLNIDYNCYFAFGGANSYHAMWDSAVYSILADYQTAAGMSEGNSRFKDVSFFSNSDLHLAGGSIMDPDLSARPIPGISDDIDGDARDNDFPYKGADERIAFTLSQLNLTFNLEACAVTDTIDVELRNTTAPYGLVETVRRTGGQGLTSVINFAKAVDGISYYIVVKHRNSIDTWSKSGGEMFSSGVLNYDFTTAASQAYGNNMVLVSGDYSFYTGDVTRDGIVDGGDGAMIDNDASSFVTGYVVTDLNCDMVVDGSDAAYADNNSANFVAVARP